MIFVSRDHTAIINIGQGQSYELAREDSCITLYVHSLTCDDYTENEMADYGNEVDAARVMDRAVALISDKLDFIDFARL